MIKLSKNFVITLGFIALSISLIYWYNQYQLKERIRNASEYMAASFRSPSIDIPCNPRHTDALELNPKEGQSAPAREELFDIAVRYSEVCANQDMDTFLKIVSDDKIQQRHRKLKQEELKLSKDKLCSEHWKGAIDLKDLNEQDIVDIKSNDLYARLVLWSKTKNPTYKSLETYIFFKKKDGKWKFLDYEQVSGFEISEKPFDERDIPLYYQLKRHKFRFLEYDLRVSTSLSKEELKVILEALEHIAKNKIVSVERATHPNDIEEPVGDQSQFRSIRMKQVNPDDDDVKINVMTSTPAGGSGEAFTLEKIAGCWKLTNNGTWIE